MKMSRRRAARLVLGAPVAAAVAAPLGAWVGQALAAQQAAAPQPAPGADDGPGRSALGKFLSRQEEGLSSAERRQVRRSVAQLEQSLKEVRDFVVTNDVPPAGVFRALRSKR
jgi:hypothetical protein